MRSSDGSCGFEPFDHTADVGLHVWARSQAELLEQATAGLASLMFEPPGALGRQARPVCVQGGSPEELVVGWLEEVVYAFEVDGFVTAEAEVTRLAEAAAEGVLRGEPFDPARHERRHCVKAVTYHDLHVAERQGRFEMRIVFDV